MERLIGDQGIVAHDGSLATKLANAAALQVCQPGELLLAQGGKDTDLCFILIGAVDVEVNGRVMATRGPGEHVGEMAMIDPTAKRSASVRAREEAVVARVEEAKFVSIAEQHPAVWQRISVQLCRRLRQRGIFVRPPNDQPIIFIGSSTERLDVARAIQASCQRDPWVVRVWEDGIFSPGYTPIESLMRQLDALDYGLLVVTPDDLVETRGAKSPSPRDNLVFETGLLMGALGRDRVFMVRLVEEGTLKLPSDLTGVQTLDVPSEGGDLRARVGRAMNEFRTIVQKLGCR